MERDVESALGGTPEILVASINRNAISGIEGGNAVGAARALLTLPAMTERHAGRFTRAGDDKPPAAADRLSRPIRTLAHGCSIPISSMSE